MTYPWWVWALFNGFIILLLAFDLGVFHRRQHTIHLKEALSLSVFYIILALFFACGIYSFMGMEKGGEFLTGYLIEKSLGIDNIFVFILIFTHFQTPPPYQHRVLFWGVLGALVLRAILIMSGIALISTFQWIIFVFGFFLILTGIKMLWFINVKPDLDNNVLIQWIYKSLPVTAQYHQEKFWTHEKGHFVFTPLFPVLVLIELNDFIFSVDSIPAIFAVSQDPFIIYTSNVFAILGLRALYFALADIVNRFAYLKYGLSLMLILIGFKMILNGIFGAHFIPIQYALMMTVVLLAGSIILSWVKSRGRGKHAPALTGWVPGSPSRRKNKK